MKNLEKLNQLLEQEQCEFVGIEDGFTGSTADGCLRLIYLMNDCVESFLVLKNARMTGNYRKGYEGELEASLERQGKDYVLVVHQGESLFTVFFEDVLFECQLYDYGSVGHFWVKGHENLRVLEYQIAILRDKYDYLGEEFCNQEERKLAALRDFPPLNYLFYASVPEKYIVPVDNPWEVSEEALEVIKEIAEETGDEVFLKAVEEYGQSRSVRMAKRIARMLRMSRHVGIARVLAERVRKAAGVYPERDFGEEKNRFLQGLMEKAEDVRRERDGVERRGEYSVVYREEPFVYDCDSVSFQVFVVTVKKGFLWQRNVVEKVQ